jgi:hypothetical protein
MLEKLHFRSKSSDEKYKFPVYRTDDRPRLFTPDILEEMGLDELWEELKKMCEHKN